MSHKYDKMSTLTTFLLINNKSNPTSSSLNLKGSKS